MTDSVKLLAEHFGVDQATIRKCVGLTRKKLENVAAADIYECVMSSIGIREVKVEEEEFLPEMTGEIFSRIPLTEFLKICTLSMKHAKACKNPQYWITYLSGKPKEDWIKIIKHFAPAKEPDDVEADSDEYILLSTLVNEYAKIWREKGIRFIFSVADSYTLRETELLERSEKGDEESPITDQILKVQNIISATQFDDDDDHYLEFQVVNDELEEFWRLSTFGKFLKELHADQSTKMSKLAKKDFLDELDVINESIAVLSNGRISATPIVYGIYTKTFQGLLNIYKNLGTNETPLEIASSLLSEDRSYTVNLDLLRDIVRSVPDVLNKLDEKDRNRVLEALK